MRQISILRRADIYVFALQVLAWKTSYQAGPAVPVLEVATCITSHDMGEAAEATNSRLS